jgi:hypothetical protein
MPEYPQFAIVGSYSISTTGLCAGFFLIDSIPFLALALKE